MTVFQFCSVESSRERRNKFFHYGHEHPGQDPILDQLALEIDNIKIKAPEEFQCNGCFRYESAFATPWTSDYWDEERHRDILKVANLSVFPFYFDICFKDCMMWLCNGNPNGQDSILIILLSLILILDMTEITDQLKYRDHITMMQAHYADLLWRYLKFKHGSEASKLFHKALMFSSTLQEANDITKRRLPI